MRSKQNTMPQVTQFFQRFQLSTVSLAEERSNGMKPEDCTWILPDGGHWWPQLEQFWWSDGDRSLTGGDLCGNGQSHSETLSWCAGFIREQCKWTVGNRCQAWVYADGSGKILIWTITSHAWSSRLPKSLWQSLTECVSNLMNTSIFFCFLQAEKKMMTPGQVWLSPVAPSC